MGWKSGAAKGAAIGSLFGPGGAMVGAGLGALLGCKDKVIIVDDDGVYFDKVRTEWTDVVNVEAYDGLFLFKFRGGLWVLAMDDNIQWEGEYREYITGEQLDAGVSLCDEIDIVDFEIDWDNIDGKDFTHILQALESVKWANELAGKLEGTEGIYVNQELLLSYTTTGFDLIEKVFDVEGFGRSQKRKQIISNESAFAALIKERLSHIDPEDEDNYELIADVFASYHVRGKDGIASQAIAYGNLRNARAYGRAIEASGLAEILAAEDDGLMPLGSVEWSKMRKKIACTDGKASLNIWSEGIKIPGTMVMDAGDIEKYNEKCDSSQRLIFEPGPPRNGCMYVQSPGNPNRYYEVNEYYRGVLEEKYNELKRLLKSLGAFEYTVEAESDRSRRVAHDSDFGASGGAEGGRWSANGEYKGQHSDSSARSMFLKYATSGSFNPSGEARVPDDLFFYKNEDEWQRVANEAISGEAKKLEITFTCKEAMSFKYSDAKEIAGELKTQVPSFKFKVEKSFKREMEEMNAVSIKFIVSFEDDLGRRAGDFVKERKTATSVKKNLTESEEKFSRYVRKFTVKNNGLVDPMTYQQFIDLAESKFQIAHGRARDIIDQAMV